MATPRNRTAASIARMPMSSLEPVLTTPGDDEPAPFWRPADLPPVSASDDYGPSPPPHLFRHPLRAIGWLIQSLYGILSLIVLLAFLAAIPILNFLALGYLLEAEGRVARTGKIRRAFHLLDVAPRLGSIALGLWLWTIPLRFLSGVATDAAIIAPGSATAANWRIALHVATALIGVHLVLALGRGGSLGCFFRPLKNLLWMIGQLRAGNYLLRADGHIREFVARLQLRHHFLLGVKGFVGALPWLVPPTLLFAAANSSQGGRILLTLVGGVALVVIFGWMPFLQAHLTAQGTLGSYRQLRSARRVWTHAPIAAFVAVLVTFALALPLNLLKIKLLPQDAMWVATLVFIISIYPARIVTAWAYARGSRPGLTPSRWYWRWSMRLLSFAALVLYTFLLFFVQDISEHGKLALFEHHAFLLPVPFF